MGIKQVAGLCARFINNEDSFQPPVPVDAAAADRYAQKEATKYLTGYIRGLTAGDPFDRAVGRSLQYGRYMLEVK